MNSLIGLANGLIKTLQRVPLDVENAQVPIFLALLDAYEQGYKDGQSDPSWDAVRRFLDPDNVWTDLGPANLIPDAPPVDAGGRPIPEEEPVVIDVETNRRVFTDLVSNLRVTWDGEIFKKNA